MSKCPYRILLADEFPLMRRGLRGLLSSHPELEVCGEVSSGYEALPLANEKRPDMIIVGMTRSQIDELEAIGSIRQACPQTQILILSRHAAGDAIQNVLDAGGADAESELLSAIHRLRVRREFAESGAVKSEVISFDRNPKMDDAIDHVLTKREMEIIRLLAQGNTNKEVAARLGLSARTVEGHRNHIMHKMAFSNFSELVRFAIRHRLIAP